MAEGGQSVQQLVRFDYGGEMAARYKRYKPLWRDFNAKHRPNTIFPPQGGPMFLVIAATSFLPNGKSDPVEAADRA